MSGLMRQILLYNFVSLLLLVVGLFHVSRFQDDLVQARKEALLAEASVTARALGDLLDAQGAQLAETGSGEADDSSDIVAPILAHLLHSNVVQARLYDLDGDLILKPDDIGRIGDTDSADDAAAAEQEGMQPAEADVLALMRAALDGRSQSAEGMNLRSQRIILAAVPVLQSDAMAGALVLATSGDDIATIVRNERQVFLNTFLIVLAVTTLLCIALAISIAHPIRLLAVTADKIRASIANRRIEVPDLSKREDEIGALSIAMRQMTQALYDQIDAVASFGADVAHELKNPLTSLRSALETLMITEKKESQEKLKRVIMDDVHRIDRLITDISAASRLGADMAHADLKRLDVWGFLRTITDIYNRMEYEAGEDSDMARVRLVQPQGETRELFVSGIGERLGQVVRNLIDNAISFSPPRAEVRICVAELGDKVEIRVEDEGPGIPEEALERVFERFYTDRPQPDAFGKNSGLGLSISRQIVETHKGRLYAQNRESPDHGARFVISLPLLSGAGKEG